MSAATHYMLYIITCCFSEIDGRRKAGAQGDAGEFSLNSNINLPIIIICIFSRLLKCGSRQELVLQVLELA